MQNRKTTAMNASTIARTAAACLTLGFVGLLGSSSNAQSIESPAVVGVESAAPAQQVAGLLVPKRTRLVIRFERTAVC